MTTYHPFGSQTYNLSGSISSTVTSITLVSFLEPITGTPYTMVLLNTDIAYATIAPKTTSSEFISFTGITQNINGTATLTGVTRGLAKKYPFTSDVAYKLPHPGQSQFIISDAPQVFEKYPAKENNETITGDWTIEGQWTFDTFPITPSNSDASSTVKGVTKLSVNPDVAANPVAVGANVIVSYAVDSVGTDSYAITPSPAIIAYTAGQEFTFKAGTANTGAATLNVSGLGAKTIKKDVSVDLTTGDILVNQIVTVRYDGTNMQMISPIGNLPIVNTYLVADSPAIWTKKAGLKYIIAQLWAGGGSGGSDAVGGNGGGGGAYNTITIQASTLGTTETITIGAGGAAVTGSVGNVGGNTLFGAHMTVYGGGGGGSGDSGAGGGGIRATGANGGSTGGAGGAPNGGAGGSTSVGAGASFGGAGGGDDNFAGGESVYGGGGGGGGGGIGGNSFYGGAGGGGGSTIAVNGGVSIYGGNGGAGGDNSPVPTAGAVPGGGGGGARSAVTPSGAGGAGKVIVTEYY